jgi:hypothetical protein
LKSGFAYPLLYTSTPLQHRNFIRNLATQIKKSDKGVWAYDKSMQFRLDDFNSIEPPNGVLVYPKLFRRSVDYLRQTQKGFSGSIIDWLNSTGAKENDSLLIDENYEMHLTDILGQNNDEIVLKYDLMSLTFIER